MNVNICKHDEMLYVMNANLIMYSVSVPGGENWGKEFRMLLLILLDDITGTSKRHLQKKKVTDKKNDDTMRNYNLI
jgi:hypothetical protein